jgi:hypothetical protein
VDSANNKNGTLKSVTGQWHNVYFGFIYKSKNYLRGEHVAGAVLGLKAKIINKIHSLSRKVLIHLKAF